MKDNTGVKTNANGQTPESGAGQPSSVPSDLLTRVSGAIADAGGWLAFDLFMAMVLYEPGLGYYANSVPKFGHLPQGVEGQGSDFVTAPELTPLFGQTLARQVAQALEATSTDEIWEFGAGTGALALQVLDALQTLGKLPRRYTIVDLSGSLRQRQQQTLAPYGERVQWASRLPDELSGVILGNEVLDAMPVQLLVRSTGADAQVWQERGVALSADGQLVWADRPSNLQPPMAIEGHHGYVTEIHRQAEAFVRTLAAVWRRGAGFLIDYGFPEAEYYHPQRHMGTLICHRTHRSDDNPLVDLGLKDITAHVNFTGVALAAQEAGLSVLGYTSQGRFLLNAGLLTLARDAGPRENAMMQKLVNEHEMGELFKVLALAPAASAEGWIPLGFSAGDRTHRL